LQPFDDFVTLRQFRHPLCQVPYPLLVQRKAPDKMLRLGTFGSFAFRRFPSVARSFFTTVVIPAWTNSPRGRLAACVRFVCSLRSLDTSFRRPVSLSLGTATVGSRLSGRPHIICASFIASSLSVFFAEAQVTAGFDGLSTRIVHPAVFPISFAMMNAGLPASSATLSPASSFEYSLSRPSAVVLPWNRVTFSAGLPSSRSFHVRVITAISQVFFPRPVPTYRPFSTIISLLLIVK
jgi:hypothetical protein